MKMKWQVGQWGAALILGLLLCFGVSYLPEGVMTRGAWVAGVVLILWLLELVPVYVPTLLLWVAIPWLVEIPEVDLRQALGWSADPVLALFFGGFALSVAAAKTGWDARMVGVAIYFSGASRRRLLVGTALATAFCSMWISNIAGAALMLVALHPILSKGDASDAFRRALLMAVAFGANFGGMATPIGSGPNAIAFAALENRVPITFLGWMIWGVPLMGIMIAGLLGFLMIRYRVSGSLKIPELMIPKLNREGWGVGMIFALMMIGWLTESWHGVSSAIVALTGGVMLFGSGLLNREDLGKIDWSTLFLIAGGLALGGLLERSGLLAFVVGKIPWSSLSPFERALVLAAGSAGLSALLSNTATATMLVPIATTFDSGMGGPMLVALAASLGGPFVISTPANAMVNGEGGVKSTDFLIPGIIFMIVGIVGLAWMVSSDLVR